MADPGVTPSAHPGPRPKQMPKRGIHKAHEVQVVASCPEDHHDRVVHICKESGMFKAFGKQGEFSDQLKSGARWFDLWKAKVCQTVLVATMHAECSVVRIFCVEGGPHCDEEFGTIPDLKKAVKDDVKKQNGREVEVVCEWMTMELFERNFGFGIHVKPDGKERKARLLGILGKDPQLAESVAVMKKHVSEEALRTCKRVVIIGETGAGKSAFCGLLEGSLQFVDGHWTSTFKLGHGGSSETNEPKLLAAQWRVRDDVLPILLLDTPGLGDSRGPQKDDEHMAEVARWVNGLGHVHAMVILLNNASRISLSLRENLQFFQRMFGKEMWDHSLMVVNRWSHDTRSQKKRQAGKLQSPKQFEEEFRQMLQQDASGDGEDSDLGVGLSKERAEKLPFFFIDTHYDRDDEDEVKSMEDELREMKKWLRSLREWKVGANSQSKELKDLILAVKTTVLAEPLKEALQTALNVAHRSSPPKDLTQEKLDAVEEEIRCRRHDERLEEVKSVLRDFQRSGRKEDAESFLKKLDAVNQPTMPFSSETDSLAQIGEVLRLALEGEPVHEECMHFPYLSEFLQEYLEALMDTALIRERLDEVMIEIELRRQGASQDEVMIEIELRRQGASQDPGAHYNDEESDSQGQSQPEEQAFTAEAARLAETQRLQELALEQQEKGEAPLPVVRLCFVGRGRAGKTTTLRRLKGESFQEDEPSTHGLDVWAGQVEADLQADLKKTHPWKRWEESMHLTALKDVLRNPLPKGPEPQGLIEPEAGSKDDEQAQSTQGLNEPEHATSVASQGPKANQPDALLESSAAAQPTQGLNKPEEHATSVASQGPNANEQPQEDISSSSGPKMCGPVVLDEDMLSKLGSQKAGIDVRLQCWDFPGQEEYALLNQLHFSERAIYLVFLDLTGRLEDEWRHLSFWLWKIARFSTEKDAWPPILLIGTKAGGHRCVTDLELQKRLEDLQSRVPRLKEQLQPHPADLGSKCTKCPWLFPVENKGKNFEAWISPLRMQLQRMALQFVSSRDLWEAENSDGSVVPRFVGLQAETFPLTWLQAHDLLTRLGAGFRARAERAHIEKVYPGAQPGSRFKIEDYLRATISDKVWLNLPPGAFIELHSQDQLDDLREEELSFDVSCDFLELKVVQRLLGGMEPKGLSLEDTEKLLDMLNKLGILMWNNEDKLRDTVVLNPRQVAVAMANLIALCFGADNFEHSKSAIEVIRKIPDSLASDLLRLRSSGIATQDLIRGVWKKDFDEASQQLFQEVLLRKDVMCGRLVQDEFLLPSCLPVAYCAEEAFRETDEVLYLDVSGLVSPNVFPALAHMIYRRINLESLSMCKKPGPPQVFRNRGDLHSDTHSVFVSLFPVSAPSDKSLLRILVRGKYQKANCALAQEVKRVLLNDILGFDPEIDVEKDPSSFFGFKGAKDKETLELERSFAREPCLNSQCNLTCSLCRVSELLQERFLPDLSPGLRSIVENAAVQRHTRPAGSFRFKAMQFPGDVDLEEYLVIDAKSKDEALPTLCRTIQKMFRTLSAQNSDVQVFMGGLKAGSNPRQNVPGVQKEWLKWSQKELCDCKKAFGGVNEAPGVMTLREALEEGHETWTAKIDMFAKVCPFEDSEATPRFFEITNVLRAGYFEGSKPIQPITKEKDSLQGIEMNLKKYSSEEPNAMKYVKRLWERSAYLAERGFDLDWHANMLEALRPLLSHWSAELSQIAAHVETLTKMMKSGRREVIEHALYDLPTLCQSLRSLQSRLESEKGSEKEAAHDGLERIRDAMKYIPEETPSESGTEKKLCEGLHKAQLLLESCVEPVVISKLGSFEFPVAKRLGELWQFPSDHPPIAAKLTLAEHPLNVASWNVLNRNYYKYIDADTQGLKGSQITTLHEAETRENVIIEKIQEMLLKTHIHILCLQECWPELIAELKEALGESLQFKMICSGDEQDKNQEVIVYDSKLRVMYVHHHAPFSENSKKVVTEVHFQLETESLRVVTTHVPGAPFGCARREFADRLAKIVNGDKLPTVLMADLNFPEKAVHPLLLDRGLEDIYFVPTPYPTNICQGSLLPKRIDSIAVINHQVAGSKLHATAVKANELLDGLDKVVELLQSRSAEPLTPTRYHSDKVETDAEKISRLERELHAARQRVKSLQSTIDSQNEERAREALLPHRPTDAPSGHFRRKVQASSVHRVEPEKL